MKTPTTSQVFEVQIDVGMKHGQKIVLQGMAKGVNDLSRGCSVDDIVHVVAITALQSEG